MKFTRLTAILLAVLLLTMAFISCQPAQDGPSAEPSGEIEATALPTPEGTDSMGSAGNSPASKEDNFKCTDDGVAFSVKADISAPKTKSFAVLEVEPSALTSEYIQGFVKKMNPDLKFYEDGEYVPTKPWLREHIEELQESTSVTFEEYAEQYAKDYGETDPDMNEIRRLYESDKKRLEYYKELYENYPDDPYRYIESDLSIHSAFYNPGIEPPEEDDPADAMRSLIVNGYNADGEKCASVYLYGNNETKTGKFQYRGPLPASFEAPKNIDEAIKLNLALLKELGFADTMTPVKTEYYYRSSDPTQQGPYTEPQDTALGLDRVAITFNRGFDGSEFLDVLLADSHAPVETLEIGAGTDGYFTFYHENPYKVLNIESAELLPFDDIYSAFVRRAQSEYTKTYVTIGNYATAESYGEDKVYPMDTYTAWDGTVTGIHFGLVRIPTEDGGYRYVPAWQFTGYYSAVQNGKTINTEKYTTVFMTINAIDGSRITGLYRSAKS